MQKKSWQALIFGRYFSHVFILPKLNPKAMHIPAWKRWFSYLIPIVIERKTTEVNPEIEIALQSGRLVLNSAEVNYSFGSLHKVFREVFRRKNVRERVLNRALVLGFGTGSVASILWKEYGTDVLVHGVEADKEVIGFGHAYFPEVFSESKLRLHHRLAESFVNETEDHFDLIVVDVFMDADVPDGCRSKEFISGLSGIMSPGGILFYNFILTAEKNNQFDKLQKYFREVFPGSELIKLSVDGAMNRVLVAEKSVTA